MLDYSFVVQPPPAADAPNKEELKIFIKDLKSFSDMGQSPNMGIVYAYIKDCHMSTTQSGKQMAKAIAHDHMGGSISTTQWAIAANKA